MLVRAITLTPTQVPLVTLGEIGQQDTTRSVTTILPSRYDYVGEINLTGSITTVGDQNYVGNTISLTNQPTLRSGSGRIEMVSGLTPRIPITGLGTAVFSFGASALGLGQNLTAQVLSQNIAINVRRDIVWTPQPMTVRDVRSTPLVLEDRRTLPTLDIVTEKAAPELAVDGTVSVGAPVVVGAPVSTGAAASRSGSGEVECDPQKDADCRVR